MTTTAVEPATEPAEAGDATQEDPEGDALFDAQRFESEELALPKIDGEGVDKIAAKFSGRVMLDRSDPRDVDLIRRMKLGQDVTVMVEAKVSGKGHGFTTNKEGDLDAVVHEVALKVESVYRPAGA
jgi:hypothetical protein